MEYQHKKECKRRNELRDYERVFGNEKLLFRNGIIPINVIRLAKCAVRKPHLPSEKDKFR